MRQAISVPDHPKLIRELRLLERRTSRAGRDIIDHGRAGSDDYANALCGMLRECAKSNWDYTYSSPAWDGLGGETEAAEAENRQWRQSQFNLYCMSGGRIRY